MKKLLTPILFAAVLALPSRAADWRPLFDGTMTGWRTWLSFPEKTSEVPGIPKGPDGKYTEKLGWDRDPLRVFTVVDQDGGKVLRASGEVFGLIMTKEPLSNFHLRLQFKWGEKKWAPRLTAVRDSGLLYFINGEQGRSYVSWPGCLEMQIQEKDTGDLYALLAKTSVRARLQGLDPKGYKMYIYDPAAEPVVFEQEGREGNRCIRLQDLEKPQGEWNTIELVCLGNDSIHIVNGQVVMRLKGARTQSPDAPLDAGLVGLQSEGAEVFFRQIEMRPITEIPKEYAEQ